MAKKEEEATKKRLERLSQSIGSLEVEEEKSYKKTVRNNKKHKDNNSFSTSEVVVLLLITVVVSLLIGGTITYKLIIKGTDIDIPLQSFIKNYEYIVNNYNGKIDEDELLKLCISNNWNKEAYIINRYFENGGTGRRIAIGTKDGKIVSFVRLTLS